MVGALTSAVVAAAMTVGRDQVLSRTLGCRAHAPAAAFAPAPIPLTPDPSRPGVYVYDSDAFYPLGHEEGFGNQYLPNNHGFTTEILAASIRHPVHVLQAGDQVDEIVSIAAVAVMDANSR